MLTLTDVLRVAQTRLAAGDGHAALDVFRQVLDRHPNNPDALFGALRAAMVTGVAANIDKAQLQIESVYRAAGAATQLSVAQAQLQDALHVLEEAASAARRALDADPGLPEAASTAYVIGHHLGQFPQYFSQFGQDHYLAQQVFKNRRGGVFVDIGAYDGVGGSNTLYFEKFMGWTGLCVEPDPIQYANLARVRSSRCVQACIGDRDGMAKFLRIKNGLTMMGGLVDHFEPADLKMISERSEASVVDVAVRRLDGVLKEQGVAAIDYLSIDTEGSELAILSSLDFSKLTIRALSVENNRNTPHIPEYLKTQGYRRIVRLGVDDIYVKA